MVFEDTNCTITEGGTFVSQFFFCFFVCNLMQILLQCLTRSFQFGVLVYIERLTRIQRFQESYLGDDRTVTSKTKAFSFFFFFDIPYKHLVDSG